MSNPHPYRHPKTAFFIFCDTKRREVREQNPSLKLAEVSRVMAQMWKALPTDERRHFKRKAATALSMQLVREIKELEAQKEEIDSRIEEKRAEITQLEDKGGW